MSNKTTPITDASINLDTDGAQDDQGIELVDIDDLRAAFGGEGHDAPEAQAGIYAPTRMCSGWN